MHRTDGGLVVDVQSDLLDPFSTRVVIPLVALDARAAGAAAAQPGASTSTGSR